VSRTTRRTALAQLGAATASALVPGSLLDRAVPNHSRTASEIALNIAGTDVEVQFTAVSRRTLRISVLPVSDAHAARPLTESLVLISRPWPLPLRQLRSAESAHFQAEGLRVGVDPSASSLRMAIRALAGTPAQTLTIDCASASVGFSTGAPVFGLGEGGHQFDRRGAAYPMKHGQHGMDLAVIGARMPVPWLMSPAGWGMFFHWPFGSFDLTGGEGQFHPADRKAALPLDIFVTLSENPRQLLYEYASLTGFPHLPPVWALGYQQSHRTLASRQEVLEEARKFRNERLPCDVLIYLGTGFCPSGWNTDHGSFTFNPHVFPDPAAMIQELHRQSFKVVLHVVPKQKDLHGTVRDTGPAAENPEDVAAYWKQHLAVSRMGVDGWWPDEGDWFSPTACLVRNRMYWEGPQLERPNLRPYALHRNGCAGIQRYGWLWSGDIESTWETLQAQVRVGINTGLSGMPFWGTDTGGFVTTPELTGELYLRWFQFSSFCTLFRSHGRTWKLRLPWGWNTGDYGPVELSGYQGKAGLPDRSELHNAHVEPICRRYLELRYRLLPYTYSAIREAHDTGLPIMRALWLHYPEASDVSGEYLWGRDLLVVPVTEKGASRCRLYLPRGIWYDFWTEQTLEGGRTIERPVDLATMPLYVRAGALIPSQQVKQYATEEDGGTISLAVYPGADGEAELYEDDGVTFDYQKGLFLRLRFAWADSDRRLTIAVAPGSGWFGPRGRPIRVRVVPERKETLVQFNGARQTVRL
jgi:alpha-glucosidase (family GH31 glycosyl hydrolase)